MFNSSELRAERLVPSLITDRPQVTEAQAGHLDAARIGTTARLIRQAAISLDRASNTMGSRDAQPDSSFFKSH